MPLPIRQKEEKHNNWRKKVVIIAMIADRCMGLELISINKKGGWSSLIFLFCNTDNLPTYLAEYSPKDTPLILAGDR
jgi:hypothetical protein